MLSRMFSPVPSNKTETVAAKVGTLRALGMRLAIDDEGAGFSSLRHILNLSPDLIKLDLTLTRDINLDRSKQALAAGRSKHWPSSELIEARERWLL